MNAIITPSSVFLSHSMIPLNFLASLKSIDFNESITIIKRIKPVNFLIKAHVLKSFIDAKVYGSRDKERQEPLPPN